MFYWLMLISVVIFQLVQKKENIFYLKLAFYLFVIGALLRVLTLNDISEFMMRTSFIFFIVGLSLSYRGDN